MKPKNEWGPADALANIIFWAFFTIGLFVIGGFALGAIAVILPYLNLARYL